MFSFDRDAQVVSYSCGRVVSRHSSKKKLRQGKQRRKKDCVDNCYVGWDASTEEDSLYLPYNAIWMNSSSFLDA